MTFTNDDPPRDRRLRAYGSTTERARTQFRPLLGPIAVTVRRSLTRWSPVLRRSGPSQALQASLLARIDVSGFNGGGPPVFSAIRSQAPSAAQILEPTYRDWTGRFGQTPRFHRKQWEHAAILAAAHQAGVLRAANSACGFGVGTEPVPAVLAAAGMNVLATDRPEDEDGHWATRGEYAQTLENITWPEICPPDEMSQRVRFRPVDMAALPADLGCFDFVWSACALEHLGSPAAGLEFMLHTLDLLNPGGLAVHTTELELTRRSTTADYGHCAVYRLEDLQQFAQTVRDRGFDIELNPYIAFEHPADRAIAPPLSEGTEDYHLKLALYDSITTSFALVVRKPA